MHDIESDIPAEHLDGDICLPLEEGINEYHEPDQEINYPPAYKTNPMSESQVINEPWSNPLGYTPGVW